MCWGGLGELWTRKIKFDPFCNAVLANFFLGVLYLMNTDRENPIPFVDPEVLEEALTVSVRVYGATSYINTLGSRGFRNDDDLVNPMTGKVGIMQRGFNLWGFAYRGDMFGVKETMGRHSAVVQSTYIGPMRLAVNSQIMFPCGIGKIEYKDGSVYNGNFAPGGRRTGAGVLSDSHGSVIYQGHWDNNPNGSGKIRVAPGVYHQGQFVDGMSTSLDLDLLCLDPTMAVPCPSTLAGTGVVSEEVIEELLDAAHATMRMIGVDLLNAAQYLLLTCRDS